MRDYGREDTDKLLADMERKLRKEYEQAAKETQAKLDDYFRRYRIKDEIWQRNVAAGKRTQQEWNQWRVGQMMVGQRWEDMRETLAEDYHNANVIARSIVNGYMPDVYAVNMNYSTFEVEKAAGLNTNFTLYNHDTVEWMMRENPDLLPPPGKNMLSRIAAGKDIAWQEGQIQSVTLQSILQGESIPHMAARIANTMGESNHKSSLRYARTATTYAENAGRDAAYHRMAEHGCNMQREWRAVWDGRTRYEHRQLDGQVRDLDEPFEVGGIEIMEPGDPTAPGYMIWNCRCKTSSRIKGLEPQARKYRDNTIEGKSYDEWKNERKSRSDPITKQEEIGERMRRSYTRELYGETHKRR